MLFSIRHPQTPISNRRLGLLCGAGLVACLLGPIGRITNADELPAIKSPEPTSDQVGPATEQRFPALQVPAGFKTTLFACDPLIEYPSVIALGPRSGTLLVAHDYVAGLKADQARPAELRLLADTDRDGYADRSSIFATDFNSIQGLAFHDGTVFAMHAPLLTSLRDTDGDGVADQRRDLFTGLGLPPEENPTRLHCANGVVAGHDGWLYLAIGDRGCDVRRPEGDRLLFRQGGILRCRPDGSDLHVFCGGLRNIYDIALDCELNVFVRDNENDGGDYMVRVCHCFHGSDHGYPYLYVERPDESMTPLADLGRGSSAGGTSYLETAFPKEYRDSLFFCEWGRAVVRYRQERSGSGFAPMQEIDFAAGARDDTYGFKPTDVVVDRDGSLLISDWADGQLPGRGRGRIYRVEYVADQTAALAHTPDEKAAVDMQSASNQQLFAQLDAPGYYTRLAAQQEIQRRGPAAIRELLAKLREEKLGVPARLHAVWIVAGANNDAIKHLVQLAEGDEDARVRAQAVRAIADLADPVLARHRLDAGRGDPKLAKRLADLSVEKNPRVMLERIIALGRLKWSGAPRWLYQNIDKIYSTALANDPAINHAAMQCIRRADQWEDVFQILDDPRHAARPVALRAVADQFDPVVVDGMITRLQDDNPQSHREYADLLTRVYKKPAPWVYWGYRPAPRPAHTVAWQRTTAIAGALDGLLADPDHDVRDFVLQRMMREAVPVLLASIVQWLQKENDAGRVVTILGALKNQPTGDVRDVLIGLVSSTAHSDPNRVTALAMLVHGLDSSEDAQLFEIATAIEDGPVLAEVIRQLGNRPLVDCDRFLLGKLESASPEVRAAVIRSLAERGCQDAAPQVVGLLDDRHVLVRRAAAAVVGQLSAQDATRRLLDLASDSDLELSRNSLESLTVLKASGAVDAAVAALAHDETRLAALTYLEHYGGPQELTALKKLTTSHRSMEILSAAVRTISAWEEQQERVNERRDLSHAVARIQADSGALLRWTTVGPISADAAMEMIANATQRKAFATSLFETGRWKTQLAAGTGTQVNLPSSEMDSENSIWLAVAYLDASDDVDVEFVASSSGSLQVWLNDKSIFHRADATAYRPNSDRFAVQLPAGLSQVLVRVDSKDHQPKFHLGLRRKSSEAEHERLTKLAVVAHGDANRGREVFFDANKFQCIKCHRMGKDGGQVGPDLTGVGSRFSRIHLIESILEPSRTVAPSYETVVVEMANGRLLAGVRLEETDKTLTLGDQQGKKTEIEKSTIVARQAQTISTMPIGLEKPMTEREFVDLIAYLLSQKKKDKPDETRFVRP